MEAIVITEYGSPDVLKFIEVEKPTPKDDEVLIKIHAASLNAYDWHLLRADPFLVRLMGGGLLNPPKKYSELILRGGLKAKWDELVQTGLSPDTYMCRQCTDAVRGEAGKVPVCMGVGVDAPRSRSDQAACTPVIERRSVLATYQAGGRGLVLSPAYAGMSESKLQGAALPRKELGSR
jgi:hypothetical protein